MRGDRKWSVMGVAGMNAMCGGLPTVIKESDLNQIWITFVTGHLSINYYKPEVFVFKYFI